MNRTAKLAFFNARRLKKDAEAISLLSGTPKNKVFKMLSGKIPISKKVASDAFFMSRYRTKNSLIKTI